MSFVKEFREFALKGNVIDLAVGVIIGAAFKTIVDAVVNDLVMPPLSLIIGKKDFTNYYVPLGAGVRDAVAKNPAMTLAEAKTHGAVFAWGDFITISLNFMILAFIIFLMVKGINTLKRKHGTQVAEDAPPTTTEKLLAEIRDELKGGNNK